MKSCDGTCERFPREVTLDADAAYAAWRSLHAQYRSPEAMPDEALRAYTLLTDALNMKEQRNAADRERRGPR